MVSHRFITTRSSLASYGQSFFDLCEIARSYIAQFLSTPRWNHPKSTTFVQFTFYPKTNFKKLQMAPNITTGKACVTFLAGNGDYVKGVVGLAKDLRRSRPSTLLWLQFCLMSTVRYWFHKGA